MGGAAEFPQRSSSPLKRRASSMNAEGDAGAAAAGEDMDVDMLSLPPAEDPQPSPASGSEATTQESPGSGEHQPAQPTTTSAAGSVLPLKNGLPPIPEQVKTIETLVRAFNESPIVEGQQCFLVSRRWLNRAQALGGNAAAAKEVGQVGPLGPVDNADIIEETIKDADDNDFVRLKQGMTREHFEIFPADAWGLVVSWCGLAEGQLPVARVAHNTSPDSTNPNIQFEMYPPVFTLHRLYSPTCGIAYGSTDPPQPAPSFMCSSSYGLQAFARQAKRRAGIPLSRKVRFWRVLPKLPASDAPAPAAKPSLLSTPPDSPRQNGGTGGPQGPWSQLLLDVTEFKKLAVGTDREELSLNDQSNDVNYNGSSTLAYLSLTVDQAIVLDENIEGRKFVSNSLNTKAGATATAAEKEKPQGARNGLSLVGQNRANNSGRSSPASLGPVTRGRSKQKSGKIIGCVGLGNLGNTCYMNSALQCIRSVEELTKYFLVHENLNEINTDNPLGHGGHIATSYGSLLDEIYRDPPPNSVMPRQFKNTIGRYAPTFSGYGQQDSQEFLGFLLDGLQEDLSRIKKKPYIEKPESTDDMVNNPQAIREMAEKVWDITRKRDDSVIADLFTGMYKSTLICPVCEKVSITFDPFNNLTLPLPVQNLWSKIIRYYPLNDSPVSLHVDLDRSSSIRALKDFVSARVGVPTERLFAAEEWKDKFFKFYDDFSTVMDEVQSSDTPAIFEVEGVPTNATLKLPKKKRTMLTIGDDDPEIPDWDSPLAERMLVPVIHRFELPDTPARRKLAKLFPSVAPPHVILLTPEESRSEDAIRRKILEKAATFTTSRLFHDEDTETDDATDTDLVPVTASDADSAGDGKVVAKSVEGEDDIVDVTMKDASESSASKHSAKYPKLLKKFQSRRPKWVDRREYLKPELQNLFTMSYFSEPGMLVPTSWSGVTDVKEYPRIDTRISESSSRSQGIRTPGSLSNGAASDNDSSQEEPATPAEASDVTRMADESGDEDLPAVKDLRKKIPIRDRGTAKVGPAGRKPSRRAQRTYSKKGAKARNKNLHQPARLQQHTAGSSSSTADAAGDDGPLVRLGEGLVVDWNLGAWETVFGADEATEVTTQVRFGEHLPIVDDPELEEKRRIRQQRRKSGLTLDECLDEFEKEEILSENDTWYCPRCKEHRRASKKFDLWKTPDILVVHLKRFSSSGWRRDKLDLKVDFPVEDLDLTTRVLDKQTGKDEVYDLIAVDDHWGGLGGGHYTAFAKNFVDNAWYEYNDSIVSAVKDPQKVVTAAAYLLFYRRRSAVPLGGPKFQEIFKEYQAALGVQADSDEEMPETAGEGQRLDIDSSQIGSSSALKGVGATLPRAGLGSGSGAGAESPPDTDQDRLPSYQQASGDAIDFDDLEDNGAPPYREGILDFTLGRSAGPVRESIEADADEGIDMGGGQDHGGWQQQPWDFQNIQTMQTMARHVSHDGANSSDGDVNSMGPGVPDPDDDDDKMGFETPSEAAEYTEPLMPDAAEYAHFEQQPPPPDSENQANMVDIRNQAWNNKRLHQVTADLGGEDQDSDNAVDIVIPEDEAGKMD